MPKVVDHDARRELIADALWAVVRRDGYAAVSVRTVAAELGMSTGALRHYFESQSELVTFAMASLVERVRARLAEVGARATDFEGVVALLEEVLPMDAQRQAESEVWLAFVAASRTEPSLRPLAEDAHRGLHSLCDSVVRVVSGAADDTPEFTTQVDALHGLVDGLAVQRTLFPKMLPRQRIRAVLRQYLTELAGRTGTV